MNAKTEIATRKHRAMVADHLGGMSEKDIADKYWLTQSRVVQVLQDNIDGYESPRLKSSRILREMIEAGKHPQEIMDATGAALSTIYRHAKDIGHQFPEQVVSLTATTEKTTTRVIHVLAALINGKNNLATIAIDQSLPRAFVSHVQAEAIRFGVPLHPERDL